MRWSKRLLWWFGVIVATVCFVYLFLSLYSWHVNSFNVSDIAR